MSKIENYYLITGSSSGLGEALSKQLKKSGFNTLGIDKTEGIHTDIKIDLSRISSENLLEIKNSLNGKKIELYGDGNNIRHWLHVDDTVDGVNHVLEFGKGGEIYNIGSGEYLSNIEIAQKAWKELAAQNHPDKMTANGVPKELLGMANEKLAIINGAYDRILKAHKIKAGSEEI